MGILAEIVAHGSCGELERLQRDPDVVAIGTLTGILGVGVVQAREWVRRGVRTVEDAGRMHLTNVQRLGIAHYEDLNKGVPRATVAGVFEKIYGLLREPCGVTRAEAVGSYRRGKEVCGDVDILMIAARPNVAAGVLEKAPDYVGWIMKGDDRLSFVWRAATGVVQVDVLFTSHSEWVAALFYFTGGKQFNEWIRGLAKAKGMRLNQRGLFVAGKKRRLRDEADIFAAIGVGFVAPEKR
jgi:DNA polymerase/3'-5' exonuclease PolX